MKKIILGFVIILLSIYIIVIRKTVVEPDMEAIVIKKPWFYGEKGVEPNPIYTSTIWHVKSTDVKLFSLKPFTIKESFENILTKDNIAINFDIDLTFRYIRGQTKLLVEKYGTNQEWYKNMLLAPMSNSIAIYIKKIKFDNIFNNQDDVKNLKEDILFGIDKFLKEHNMPIEIIDINILNITPPKEILDNAIKEKSIKQKIKIEKLKQKAKELSANADRAYMLKMGMTPRQYLELKRIELENIKLANEKCAIESAKDGNSSIQVHINMGG